jgi:hypothetical protein
MQLVVVVSSSDFMVVVEKDENRSYIYMLGPLCLQLYATLF